MAEFKPIETQEELDALIASRLERERAKVRAEYADYDTLKQTNTTLQEQLTAKDQQKADLASQITDLTARVQKYETDSVKTRIAHEKGLPYEIGQRLTGETEEDIRADADALVKLLGQHKDPAPLYNPDNPTSEKDAALRDFARKL